MRISSPLLRFLAFCAMVGAGPLRSAFAGPADSAPSATKEKNVAVEPRLARPVDRGHKWAVVIGVNEYLDPSIPKLRYCVADARQFATTLLQRCGYDSERVLLVVDDQAKAHLRPLKINLQKQIPNWLKHAASGDTVTVFFSGHGFLDDRGQGFLAPQDCEKANLGLTAFRTEELRDMLHQCAASQKLLVLDCCHAGSAKAGDVAGPSSQEIGQTFQKAEGLVTLASCRKKEFSQEWKDKGHGLFTHFLVQGLEGKADYDRNGLIDSDELYRYVFEQVPLAAQQELNAQQTPVRIIGEDVVGVFPLGRVAGERSAPAHQPTPQAVVAPERPPPAHQAKPEPVIAAQVWRAMLQMLSPPAGQTSGQGEAAIRVAIWFGDTLNVKNVSQLESLAPALAKGGAKVTELVSSRAVSSELLESAVAKAEATCSLKTDGRMILEEKALDVVVFIGHLNAESSQESQQGGKLVPSADLLDRYVTWACQAGKDVYVFDDLGVWKPQRQTTDDDERPLEASRKYKRIVWYAGRTGGEDFAKFLQCVKSRAHGPGQITSDSSE